MVAVARADDGGRDCAWEFERFRAGGEAQSRVKKRAQASRVLGTWDVLA